MISWQASVAGDGKRVAAVCFGGCFQHFTASPTSSSPSSSSPSSPSSSSSTSSLDAAVANLVTESYEFTLSGQCCRQQQGRTAPLCPSPHPAASSIPAAPAALMVVPEENAAWRSDGRHGAACGGSSSVGNNSGGSVQGFSRQQELCRRDIAGLPRTDSLASSQIEQSLQQQQQQQQPQANSRPFQETHSLESFSSSVRCCSPSRSGTEIGADSSFPQQQRGEGFPLSRSPSLLPRGEEEKEEDDLSPTSPSSSFPQCLSSLCTTSGEVRYPALPGSPLHQQHQTTASHHHHLLQSQCLAASAASASAAADRGGKDIVVPMVALECELPRSGRLSPPGADVAFTFLPPPAVSSSSSPSSNSSSGRISEDSAAAAAAAIVTDSVYCPGTMLPQPMPSTRSAVSSTSDNSSSGGTATGSESGGGRGQPLYCPSVVSSSPFSQTVSSTSSSNGSNASCSNLALLAAADSPHCPVTTQAISPCLHLGDEERPPPHCHVAMSTAPLLHTFCTNSSNNSDANDPSVVQHQQQRSLLESPQHLFSSSSSASSASSACGSRAGCKRRFPLHLREEEVDAECSRPRVNGLNVGDALNVESASSIVTCGRCGEECNGSEDESPSKRRKLLHEDVVDSVLVETESPETNDALMGDEEEMTQFSVETVDVVTASDEDDHIPRFGSSSSLSAAAAAVTEHDSVAVVVEASETFDVVDQPLRDSVLEEEAESIAEVDVVGHESTPDDSSPHFQHYPHHSQNFHLHYQHSHHHLHHQSSTDIAMDEGSAEDDNATRHHSEDEAEVEPAATTVVTTEETMEQQHNGIVGDCENSSEDGENDHEQDHDSNNDNSNSANGEDADVDDDEDDDSAFFYPAHRSQRISPFLNTPKQRKEERRKILKLSIHKMRAVEDPEHFLRRSVLINNTMKRLQRELREEKMRNSPRRGCYGLYRRASALHYDVLNNSYLLHDEPFTPVSENDRITDDMTDALVTRLEATTSSPIVVPTPSPSPSPSPSPADEPDTSSAAFPTTSLSLSCSSSSTSLASSSSASPLETSASPLASCSLDITSTVGESSSPCISPFSEAVPSSSSLPMSEDLVLHSSHHHQHHHLHYSRHHHPEQPHHSHDHEESVHELMPSLEDDVVESEVSEALSTTTITTPAPATSLSVSDLSSTVVSSLSSTSSPPPSCSSSNLSSSASSPSLMYEGVFGVPSVVREAQSSGTSCSSESQREKQLYADIDTVFNLIHALGDS